MFARRTRGGRWIARTALVGLAAGALALFGSGSALAFDNTPKAAPNAAAEDLPAGGAAIGTSGPVAYLDYKDASGTGHAPVVRITLRYSDGSVRTAYCIDFNHEANKAGSEYDPGEWNESNVKNLPDIQWILSNSYPNVDAATVLKTAGADVSGLSTDEQNFVAYAGTQTAIWNYSDGVQITGNSSKQGLSDAEYAAFDKLRTYLIDKATNAPEPTSPTLSVSPSSASGYAGEAVGPFTVTTTGTVDKITLAPSDGTTAVDSDGKPITDVRNGTKFYLKSSSEGQATVTASGTGQIPTGQVYLAKGGPQSYQKLILADTATKPLSAQVSTTLTASPSPSPAPSSLSPTPVAASPTTTSSAGGSLPVTGTSLTLIVGAAVVLLGGGAALIVMARRRRHGL